MDQVSKAWLSMVGIACITIAVCLSVYFYFCSLNSKRAFESGYVQDTLKGREGVYWVKPDNRKE